MVIVRSMGMSFFYEWGYKDKRIKHNNLLGYRDEIIKNGMTANVVGLSCCLL